MTLGPDPARFQTEPPAGYRARRSLQTHRHFAARDALCRVVLERMLAGVSTRRDGRTQEPVGAEVGAGRAPTSKSAVSREFVARETLADAVMTVDERVVQRVEAFGLVVLAPIAPRSLALVR